MDLHVVFAINPTSHYIITLHTYIRFFKVA